MTHEDMQTLSPGSTVWATKPARPNLVKIQPEKWPIRILTRLRSFIDKTISYLRDYEKLKVVAVLADGSGKSITAVDADGNRRSVLAEWAEKSHKEIFKHRVHETDASCIAWQISKGLSEIQRKYDEFETLKNNVLSLQQQFANITNFPQDMCSVELTINRNSKQEKIDNEFDQRVKTALSEWFVNFPSTAAPIKAAIEGGPKGKFKRYSINCQIAVKECPLTVLEIAEQNGWLAQHDAYIVESWIDQAITENPEAAQQVRTGHKKAKASFGFLIGAVMKLSNGTAPPIEVKKLLEEKLKCTN